MRVLPAVGVRLLLWEGCGPLPQAGPLTRFCPTSNSPHFV